MLRRSSDYLLSALFLAGLLLGVTNIFSVETTRIALILINALGLLPVARSAWQSLKQRQISIDLLASIALIFSLIAGELLSAVFINLMLAFARIFSGYTQSSIHGSLKKLLKLHPEVAKVARGNDLVEVSVREIKVGDHVVVKLGERIPTDGVVIKGEGSVDQSSFTGESMPVEKKVDDTVLTSTLLVNGELEIEAKKVGADTSFAKVLRLMSDAEKQKSKISGLGQKFASYYVTTVLVAAIVILLFSGSLNLVLSMLLVVCADDIAIAVPLAFTAAMAMAARKGILIKGGIYLESLGKTQTILFDKTGTLTTTNLQIKEFRVVGTPELSSDYLVRLAGSLADYSTHPISNAVHKYMHQQNLRILEVSDTKESAGGGVQGQFDGKLVKLGKWEFVTAGGSTTMSKQLNQLSEEGNNLTFISVAGEVSGVFVISTQVKSESKQAVESLKQLGITDLVMLTGDNKRVASAVSAQTGVTDFRAELLPEDKLKVIEQKIQSHKVVAMVGDGVNDAPALNLATVGIAMGAVGSDVAIESADIVLMQDDLNQIPYTVRLGRRVNAIARQNFGWWVILNAVGLTLVFGGVLDPATAALYNFVTDIFTILNAMRAMRPLRAG